MDYCLRRMWMIGWVTGVLLAGQWQLGAGELNPAHEAWYVIELNESRVGYRFIRDTKYAVGKESFYKTEIIEHYHIKRLGQILDSTLNLVIVENEFGQIQEFKQSIETNGQGNISSSGKLQNGSLVTETTIAGKAHQSSIKLPAMTTGPEFPRRYLRTEGIKAGVPMAFNVFMPANLTVSQLKLSLQGDVDQKLYDGKSYALKKVSIHAQNAPVKKSYLLINDLGEVKMTYDESAVGKEISYRVSKQEAMEKLSGSELDVAISSMFQPEPALKLAHTAKKIVYRLSIPDGELKWKFSDCMSHEIKVIDKQQVEITAQQVLLPKFAKIDPNKKLEPAVEDCLKSTMFVQSDAELVKKLANESAISAINPAQIAKMQENYVFKKVSKNEFSSNLASALEVAESLKGDCTEHAVLLCAMLRAKKIPSRVAIGMVYLDGYKAFGGHMWTEVYLDGKWYSLDATQGQGGISPAYLKIADTPLLENSPVPNSLLTPLVNIPRGLKIEVLKEE